VAAEGSSQADPGGQKKKGRVVTYS
jgi:hypothetical protein